MHYFVLRVCFADFEQLTSTVKVRRQVWDLHRYSRICMATHYYRSDVLTAVYYIAQMC